MLFSDRQLAQRLELTEAQANMRFVETRQRFYPQTNACWRKVAGAVALFDGLGSPLTQTFGLGLSENIQAEELTQLESFFTERQASVYHEVSPLAEPAVLSLLPHRGYFPSEYTNVLYRSLSSDFAAALPHPPTLRTRRILPTEAAAWARTLAAGWSTESPDPDEFELEFGNISSHSAGFEPFFVELADAPIAAGGLFMHEGVALLMGASTIPTGRRQGAQSALLATRLAYAASHGCTLAMMGALPGSQSQRNAEKNGFRVAYTRIKWQLRQH